MIRAVILVAYLTLSFTGLTRAQHHDVPPLTIALTIGDAQGHERHLTFGVHPDATYGFDTALGEQLVPPVPPVPVFDARFVDLPGQKRVPSTGVERDIRRFISTSQVDTFMVRFQPAENALPLQFGWAPDLQSRCENLVFEFIGIGNPHSIDGMEQGSFVLNEQGVNLLRIILQGPRMMPPRE